MGKVVINCSYGQYELSNDACVWLASHGIEVDHYGRLIDKECKENPIYATPVFSEDYKGLLGNPNKPIPRHNPLLIQCVEELGKRASGRFAKLIVVIISGNLYRINNYDGFEQVETPEDVDWIIIT